MSTTPRIARSLDDLERGQWIAFDKDETWETRIVDRTYWAGQNPIVAFDVPEHVPGRTLSINFRCFTVVILSDQPPPPVTVPRDNLDALREAMDAWESVEPGTAQWGVGNRALVAARSLLDAVDAASVGTGEQP